MSRGHGWVQRIILETITQSPRYGFTDRDLVGHVYQAYDDEITEAQIVAVRRAVRALLAEGVIVEKTRDVERRRISFADSAGPKGSAVRLREPRVTAESLTWLHCAQCDVHWQRQGAELCWSCGGPGEPLSRPAA
jgi:hypothetical protein